MPTVEAVVVTYRRPRNLLPILRALRAQTHPLACITVIDACPTPADRPPAEAFALASRTLRLDFNLRGFNRYIPLGAYREDYTLFLDDDFISGPGAVAKLVNCAATAPDFGVIGQLGRLVTPTLEYQPDDIRAETDVLRPVDTVVRGYFVRTGALPSFLAIVQRIPFDYDYHYHDDLALCVAMSLHGFPVLVYRPTTAAEALIAQGLPEDFASCQRPTHYPERTAFLRWAKAELGWEAGG